MPTLLFGIPGSGSMAVFIGGMILLGYDAGPQMIQNDLPITYTVVWSLALANVFGAGLCLALSGGIARLTTIRFPLLVPFLFMMIAFAAFQSKQTLWDLAALVAAGLIGIFLRRFEWPRPAFLIGFVLCRPGRGLHVPGNADRDDPPRARASKEGLGYVFSPIVLIILLITVVSVVAGRAPSPARSTRTRDDRPAWNKRPAIIFHHGHYGVSGCRLCRCHAGRCRDRQGFPRHCRWAIAARRADPG